MHHRMDSDINNSEGRRKTSIGGSNNLNQTAYVDGGESFDMEANHTSRLQSD